MTPAALETLLRGITRPVIVTVLAETEPEMVKKDRETGDANPFADRVTKYALVNGIIGCHYGNCVNNQRLREADPQTQEEAEAVPVFEPLPRSWGTRLDGTPLVEHNDNLYLEVKVERVLNSGYKVDGRLATPAEVAEIERYLPRRRSEGRRQEVERPVVWRDYRLDHVVGLRLNGQQLEVEG